MLIIGVSAPGSYALAMRYLSQAWLEAADHAVRAAAASAPVERVVIDQHVEGLADYRVTIARNDASVVRLDHADTHQPADAVFRQSAETAEAVARGTTDAHQAFLLGHITFDGNIDVLIARRESFDWLAQTLAPVLATTTFPDPPGR